MERYISIVQAGSVSFLRQEKYRVPIYYSASRNKLVLLCFQEPECIFLKMINDSDFSFSNRFSSKKRLTIQFLQGFETS